MNYLKKLKQPHGIGFLEMIAALGVIITGVIGGLTLTTYNLASSSASEGRLLAANLAREGIEVIRNQRDSNWLADTTWSANIVTGNNYRLIVNFNPEANNWLFTDQIVGLKACDACRLYYHPDTGVFNHLAAGGNLTTYKRLITLRQICWLEQGDEELVLANGQLCSAQSLPWVGWEVEAQVSWIESAGEHELSIIDRLYDWK